MANTAQARKRARQSVATNLHKAAASDVFQKATGVIDRVADKNIIHKNKAARHKSRLSAAIKSLA